MRAQIGLPPRRSDDSLSKQVKARVEELARLEGETSTPAIASAATGARDARSAYVEDEYLGTLEDSEPRERAWRRFQIYFTVALFGFGALGTITASLKVSSGFWHVAAIAAGALVASLTTINQALAPGTKAAAYGIGYAELRDEGWDYVCSQGVYKKYKVAEGASSGAGTLKKDLEAYDLFASRVRGIARRTRAQTQTREVRTR